MPLLVQLINFHPSFGVCAIAYIRFVFISSLLEIDCYVEMSTMFLLIYFIYFQVLSKRFAQFPQTSIGAVGTVLFLRFINPAIGIQSLVLLSLS